jgi:hypothetical protein
MRIVVSALLQASRSLSNVMVIWVVVFVVYCGLGVNLFMGSMRNHCVFVDGPLVGLPAEDENVLCSAIGLDARACPSVRGLNTSCTSLQADSTSFANPALFRGLVHFDDVIHSFISVFIILTKNGWIDIMYRVRNAVISFLLTLPSLGMARRFGSAASSSSHSSSSAPTS